jgi:cell division cycle 14
MDTKYRLAPAPPITLLTFADRLYLASYVEAPDANTLFPYPDPPPRSPSKWSQRSPEGPTPAQSSQKQPFYFTVDDTLLYNAFHHDFGPLHIGHLYRFALQFHEILGAKENKDRPIVFWSRADPRSMSSCAFAPLQARLCDSQHLCQVAPMPRAC